MSKIDELRLHGRNRKLPPAIKLGQLTPEITVHNLFIYHSLADNPENLTGEQTAQHRHEHAVAGVSTGERVYELGDFYNQIHTDEITLHCPFDVTNKRYAMLDPDNHLDYHMDPPNTFNIICPLSDPITIKALVGPKKEDEYTIDIGEVWFINPSYAHASFHESKDVRVAVLANFEYTEEVYDHLTRLL
jgi:hypothetical protein